MDEHLFRLLYGAAHGSLTTVMAAFTILGSGWTMLALVPLLPTRHRRLALTLTGVLCVTAALVAVLKRIVHRVRPCASLAGVHALWSDAPTDSSFPSGHAAGGFAVALFIVTLALSDPRTRREGWRWGLSALVLATATCIALSRVYLGVHFPGDVAGGALLGAAMGVVGARLYRV